MPFAGYKTFAACVAANSDKGDPEAYCATIMRAVEKVNPDHALVRKHPGSDGSDMHDTGSKQDVHRPRTARSTPAESIGPGGNLGKLHDRIRQHAIDRVGSEHMPELFEDLAVRGAEADYSGLKINGFTMGYSGEGRVLVTTDTFDDYEAFRSPDGSWLWVETNTPVAVKVGDFIDQIPLKFFRDTSETSIPLPEITTDELVHYLEHIEEFRNTDPAQMNQNIGTTTHAELDANDQAMYPFEGHSTQYRQRTEQGKNQVASLMERIAGEDIQAEWHREIDTLRENLSFTYDQLWEKHTGMVSTDGFDEAGNPTWMRAFQPVEMIGQGLLPGIQTQSSSFVEPGVTTERVWDPSGEGIKSPDFVVESTPRDINYIGDLIEFGYSWDYGQSDDVTRLPAMLGVPDEDIRQEVDSVIGDWSGRLGVESTSTGDDILYTLAVEYTKVNGDLGLDRFVDRTRDQWAASSTSPESLAVHAAANDVFGLDADTDHFETNDYGGDPWYDGQALYERLPFLYDTYVRATYVNTQAGFDDMGITHVPVIRGMGMNGPSASQYPSSSRFGNDMEGDFDPAELNIREVSSFKPHPLFPNLTDPAEVHGSTAALLNEAWERGEEVSTPHPTALGFEIAFVPNVRTTTPSMGITADLGRFAPSTPATWKARPELRGTPLADLPQDATASIDVIRKLDDAREMYVGSMFYVDDTGQWAWYTLPGSGISVGALPDVEGGRFEIPDSPAITYGFQGFIADSTFQTNTLNFHRMLESRLSHNSGIAAKNFFFDNPQSESLWSDVAVDLQPLSSYTTKTQTARGFENRGKDYSTLNRMSVPVDRIWAHSLDGFGSLSEHEILVLGGRDLPVQLLAWEQNASPPVDEIQKVLVF